jgi:HAD superfamily hydrolase (TIGR01509 family)
MEYLMIKGFVFDLDGLILDTETPQFECWQELYAEYGLTYTLQDWWKAIGTGPSTYDPATELKQQLGDQIEVAEIHQRIRERIRVSLQKQPLCPGVENFLEQAFRAGIPMDVASSSASEWVNGFIQKFDLNKYFQAIFTARDVAHVKPDPALYQLATQHLGLKPAEVMAFEDSLNGLKAAKAAGIFCTVVPSELTAAMDFSSADRILPSFEVMKLADILATA